VKSGPEKADPQAPASENREPFLSRWSRRKGEAKREAQEQPAQKAPDPDTPAPALPPLEKLTLESDYRGFFHPKVSEDLRRAALKRLFTDPHFNVMDGLDVYIEDYSKSEPLPAAMLASLKQAQNILDWAREKNEGTETSESGAARPAAATGAGGRIEAAKLPDAAAPGGDRADSVQQVNGSMAAGPAGKPADR
jgi:hypothetical protein